MDTFLIESFSLLSAGILVFVLGRLRVIKTHLSVPFFLSSFIFIGFYGVKVFHEFVIPFLGFTNKLNRVLFYDYGNGLLGLLPLALAILFIGKHLLKIDYDEQWSGTTNYNLPSLKYGMISGIVLATIPLIIVVSTGQKFSPKVDLYRYGINCVTNLYEEVICRGLLLACCVKYWNKLFAVVWTSVVFGLAHGLTEKGFVAWLCGIPFDRLRHSQFSESVETAGFDLSFRLLVSQ